MTLSKLPKPPALPTWMLEHLALGSDKDALAGDLLEEFVHRRSVAWYWRQVLIAIFVGFSEELGRQWRAACFALVWTIASVNALNVWYQTYRRGPGHLFGWALSHDWPVSGILTTSLEIFPQFLMWWLGLCFYLLMMRSFSARRFARGMLISLFCMLLAFGTYLSVGNTVMRFVRPALPQQTIRFIAIRFIAWMPYFLALLLSFCATLPSAAIKRARIRISD